MVAAAVVAGCGGSGEAGQSTPSPWSAPRALEGASGDVDLTATPDGVLATALAGGCEERRPPISRVALLNAEGRPGIEGTVARGLAATPVGADRVAVLALRTGRSNYVCGGRGRLSITVGPLTDPDRASAVVSRARSFVETDLVSDRAGRIAVAWSDIARGRSRLWLRVRSAGGALGRPHLVARGDEDEYYGMEVGSAFEVVPAPGGFTVVYARSSFAGTKHARLRAATTSAGGRVRRDVALGRTSDTTDLAVATDAKGRAVAVWGAQDGGEERTYPYAVRVVRRSAGASRFGPVQRVDPGARPVQGFEEPHGRPLAALAGDGTAVVAWARARDEPTGALRVAIASPDGRFGRPVDLGQAARFGALAVRDDGAVLVGWRTRQGRLVATLRRPGATAFERPEPFTSDRGLDVASAAFDPRSGRPLLVWGKREELGTVEPRLAIRERP